MNNIEENYQKSKSISEFATGYFEYLKQVLDLLDPNSIEQLSAEFEKARENGNTIFVAGNGGSAATATTMANDIGFDIIKKTEGIVLNQKGSKQIFEEGALFPSTYFYVYGEIHYS